MKKSVIIPTLNRQTNLKKSIKAILNNSLLPDEIIVVEQWNLEKTKKILKDIDFDIKIFFLAQKSASKARNYWVKKSSWKILFFIDDDLEIDKNYIKTAYNFFKKNKNVKIISGKDKLAKIPKINFFKKLIRVLTYQDIFWDKRIVLKNGINIVRLDFKGPIESEWASWTMVVKKEVFKKFEFPKNFLRWSFSEDVFFSYQVYKYYWKKSIYFLPNLTFNHLKSKENRIEDFTELKMKIIYRFIFWKTEIYNNNFFYLLIFIYSNFFSSLFFIKNSKNKKEALKIIISTYKFIFKNFKNFEKIDFNKFIFQ